MTKERPGEREAVARDLEWCRQAALVARRGPVSFAEFTRALATATRALESLAPAQSAKDAAYSERNRMVAFLSRLYPSSLERHPESEPWEDDWRWIVFVDLPTGQATWHIHDSELAEFAHLPRETGRKWDGHDTEEKYRRLATLSARGGTEGPVAWEVVDKNGDLATFVAPRRSERDAEVEAQLANGERADGWRDPRCPYRVRPLYPAPTRARQDALEEGHLFGRLGLLAARYCDVSDNLPAAQHLDAIEAVLEKAAITGIVERTQAMVPALLGKAALLRALHRIADYKHPLVCDHFESCHHAACSYAYFAQQVASNALYGTTTEQAEAGDSAPTDAARVIEERVQ